MTHTGDVMLMDQDEPTTYQQAMSGPDSEKWLVAMKSDMDGNVITFKGRLVTKGFKQIHGIDYDETFSPVAMLKSIRILF
ncbi:reverse transcriptase domain-containing protein, partial [Escherichia coli]|uniref:reverse transcriptase domain-containing protein n=1 Tax=Escherichia coli TaxID=562 RepID=UPI00200F14ED